MDSQAQFDTKYILPIYEHKEVNGKNFTFIKCFVGYKVLSHKEVDRAKKHLSKAELKIKVLTGSNKGEIYNGRYMCSSNSPYEDDYLLTFGGKYYFDKVCLYNSGDEVLLFDYDLKYNLRIPHLDEKGEVYGSVKLGCYFEKYMSQEDLQKLQDEYNSAIKTLYDQEAQKDVIKPTSIF